MNLLYDLIASQPNNDGDYHGGGKYAKKVFIELIKVNNNEKKIYGLYDSSKPLDKELKETVANYKIVIIDIRTNDLKDIFHVNKINCYYSALPYNIGFTFFDVLQFNCTVIVTIHGIRTLEMPLGLAAFQYAGSYIEKIKILGKILLQPYLKQRDFVYYKKLIEKVKVITISNHSKFNILTYFPNYNDDISVYYSPDVTEYTDDQLEITSEEKDYFLMVSGNRWIKNNLKSAIALDELFTARKEIKNKVIITGVVDKNIFLKRIKNVERFVFYKYVNEDILNGLYKHAFAFLYMTMNEGFGYPPIEAMKHGTPVIASPHTSITEICCDAVLYANPYSKNEIKNRIIQLLFDRNQYLNLEEKGKKRFHEIQDRQKTDLKQMINYILHNK